MEIDSRVASLSRLVELELGELSQKFTDLNWDTYAKLAFAGLSSALGIVDEVGFKRQVLAKFFVIPEGQDMPAQATVVGRLWYESHIFVRLRCHCLPRQQCHGGALVRCFVKYAREAHVLGLKVYEVFCGHAGCRRNSGRRFDTVPIDWAGNRHKPRVPIRVSNLLEIVNVEELIRDLQAGRVFFIWWRAARGVSLLR